MNRSLFVVCCLGFVVPSVLSAAGAAESPVVATRTIVGYGEPITITTRANGQIELLDENDRARVCVFHVLSSPQPPAPTPSD